MATLDKLESTLKELSLYVGTPLTPEEQRKAKILHLRALTECRIALAEQAQQGTQEQQITERIETLQDIVQTILIEIRQMSKALP